LNSVPAGATVELSPWQHQSVLVVDDEPGMVSFLHRSLALRCGWVATAGSVEEAVELLSRRHFDLIVLDIALPGRSGVEWLHDLRAQGFAGDVVLMTAYADLETAIDALRAGASDFLLKPFSVAQMLNAVKRCFERSSLRRENFVLRRELEQRDDSVEGMVGKSAVIRDVCARIKRIAPTPSTVLIHGESGTGKELAARALHRMSLRSDGPFVPINCAAIAEELIESELFGHVKGAFTGAAAGREGLFYYARGGTLFLDEISELPLPLQAKLLRVLEERRVRPVGSEQEVPVDVRVVAATNRDLVEEVAAGRFRRDLYYRLQVVEVVLPPLRERIEDLPDLVDYFIGQLAARLGVAELAHDEAALARLARYSWPGNVRELKNLVERSLILGYFADDFAPDEEAVAVSLAPTFPSAADEDSLAAIERRHILGVLETCKGNKSEAARRLGVSRKTLERKCAAWGV
jgi:DNA-binding NtrC family response regulator